MTMRMTIVVWLHIWLGSSSDKLGSSTPFGRWYSANEGIIQVDSEGDSLENGSFTLEPPHLTNVKWGAICPPPAMRMRESTHATPTQSMEDREGQLQLKNAKWGLRMHSLLLSESFPPFSFSLFHTHFHFHWYIWEKKISCCSNQQQLHWCPKNPLPLYNLSFLNISLCL